MTSTEISMCARPLLSSPAPAIRRPEQLFLPGFQASFWATDRLFFAVLPDAATAASIARHALEWRAQHGLLGRPLPASRLHVSLYHLGDYIGLPQNVLLAAAAAAEQIAHPPFQLNFQRTTSFSGGARRRAFVLLGEDDTPLHAFRRTLGAALAENGLGRFVGAGFTPHMTLLHDPQGAPEQEVEPIRWTAGEFVLVHSLLGKTKHIVLARWPLRG